MASSRRVAGLSKIPAPEWLLKSSTPARLFALQVSHIEEDHRFLEEIFSQKQWTLFSTHTIEEALSFIRGNRTPVVICERDAPVGGWKKILSGIQELVRPPLLIVTSRLADDHLWAEVLNLGGHDVLATPFRAKELEWALENAWRRFGFMFSAKRGIRIVSDRLILCSVLCYW